ncbi:MAG: flagellar biosynthetic protein FliR [Planctomycetota bacterium]
MNQIPEFLLTNSTWWLPFVVSFAWIALRILGFFLALPTLMSGMDLRMKVGLVFVIACSITPSVVSSQPAGLASTVDWIDFMIAAGRELLLGSLLGSVVQLMIVAMRSAGELISIVSGIGLGQTADPATGESTNAISRLVVLLMLALFLLSGGHRLFLDAMLDSFKVLPAGTGLDADSVTGVLVGSLANATACGLRLSAPVVICLLISNLAVALVSRITPHLNVFAIGMNANMLSLLIILAFTIGTAGLFFDHTIADQLRVLSEHFR